MSCVTNSTRSICRQNASTGIINVQSGNLFKRLPKSLFPLARVLAQYPTEQSLIRALDEFVHEPVSDYLALLIDSNEYSGVMMTGEYFSLLERKLMAIVERVLDFLGYSDAELVSTFSDFENKKEMIMSICLRELFVRGLKGAMDNPVGLSPEHLVESLITDLLTTYQEILDRLEKQAKAASTP